MAFPGVLVDCRDGHAVTQPISFEVTGDVFRSLLTMLQSNTGLGNTGFLLVLGVSLVVGIALTVLAWVRRG